MRWLGAAALAASVLAPALASARTPLPTVEVVQPPRRLRLLDVRGPFSLGNYLIPALLVAVPNILFTTVEVVNRAEVIIFYGYFVNSNGVSNLYRGFKSVRRYRCQHSAEQRNIHSGCILDQ